MEVAARLLSIKRKATISHGVIGRTKHENRVAKYVVESVKSVSPAAKIGLKTGDVITTVDGRKIHRTLDFERALLTRKAGEKIVLNVSRGNENRLTSSQRREFR